MPQPKAVLISDIHFSVQNLHLASCVLSLARNHAHLLGVPLVLCGDTLDTKAIMRGECVNKLIEVLTMRYGNSNGPRTIILVGNHDKIHERSVEHTLNFLKPYAQVIERPTWDIGLSAWLIPYESDKEVLQRFIHKIKKDNSGKLLIMHTGIAGANMGHYVVDKSSLPVEEYKDFRVISGHYHTRQDIKCSETIKDGHVGLFSYVGNPYTLTYGEANDPPKGFQILMSDGSLEFVPTELRKHAIYETTIVDKYIPWQHFPSLKSGDLLWLKIKGRKSELANLTKYSIGNLVVGNQDFKLDLIPTDDPEPQKRDEKLTDIQVLHKLVQDSSESESQKKYLIKLIEEII